MSSQSEFTSVRQGVNSMGRSDKANTSEALPLSYAQEGLWIVEQITPGTAAHNLPEAWQLNGPLDVQLLRRSLDQIICRHEALRTCFLEQNGEPVPVVLPARPIALPLTDLAQRADKQRL